MPAARQRHVPTKFTICCNSVIAKQCFRTQTLNFNSLLERIWGLDSFASVKQVPCGLWVHILRKSAGFACKGICKKHK